MNILSYLGVKKGETAPEPLTDAQPEQEQETPLRETAETPKGQSEAQTGYLSSPDHLVGLIGNDFNPEEEFDENIGHDNSILGKEDWSKLIAQGFMFSGVVFKYETLKAVSYSDDVTKEAFHALYDTFYDMPRMHFVLRPFGKWATRAAMISAFALPLGAGLNGERKARKAEKAEPAKEQQEPEQGTQGENVEESEPVAETESNAMDFGNYNPPTINA